MKKTFYSFLACCCAFGGMAVLAHGLHPQTAHTFALACDAPLPALTPNEKAIFAMQAADKQAMENMSLPLAKRKAASANAQQLVRLLVKVDRANAGK